MIILEIIGGIVLAIVVIIFLIYVYFRIKFGKYLNMEPEMEPLAIHLVEDVSPDWSTKPKVKVVVKELHQLGFTAGKAFTIYEMDGYSLQSFYQYPVVAVVYWHEVVGCWVDMVAKEIDSKDYTFSNAPMGGGLNYSPECEKTFDTSASLSALYESISSITRHPDKKFSNVNGDNFRDYFESAYKKDMAWKNRNGGVSYEEFLNIEKEMPFKTRSKNIKEAFVLYKEAELERWHNLVAEEYCKHESLKGDEKYEVIYKLIIVPFKGNASAFLNYLESKDFINESQLSKFTELYENEFDMYALFEKINNLLSPELRAELVREVDFPLSIKLYQLSDNMDYSDFEYKY